MLAGVLGAPAVSPLSLHSREQTAFVDVSAILGIDVDTPHEFRWDTGSGAAFVDCDGDGDLDLYVAMGHNEANRMYLLDPVAGTYEDFADALGCADAGSGKGVKFADYDNDGDPDLFIANLDGPDRLYRNEGEGRYIDVTAEAGVGYDGKSHGAAWADYNNDGWLDLYVCDRARDQPDLLWLNRKDGTFQNFAAAAGVANATPPSCEVVWFDYDNDGDQDIYVSVDGMNMANRLFRNNGDGRFTDVAVQSKTQAYIDGMGIAVGDYNNDGYEDLYITHTGVVYGNPLFRNNGDGTFTDTAPAMGVESDRWGWGTEFFDYDNDGDQDLYVVNWSTTPGGTGAGNQMFENLLADGGSTFRESTSATGTGDRGPGFGLAVGDYNDDGAPDMFIVNRDVPSVFYQNTLASNGNNWLKVQTIGRMGRTEENVPKSNRDGVGARVTLATAAGNQYRVIRSASSYLSMSSLEAEFGVGRAITIDRVEVKWPSGVVDVFENVEPNQTLVVCEGGWPVEFESVEAVVFKAGVDLAWELLCEGETSAFQVFRQRESTFGFDPAIPLATLDASVRNWTDDTVEEGVTYRYHVNAVGPGADAVGSGPVDVSVPSPTRYLQLQQNYPNPFTPQTTIVYGVERAGRVRLAVYDARGTLVEVLVDRFVGAGEHEFVWRPGATGPGLPAGGYFLRLETPDGQLTRKTTLVR